MLPFPCMLSIFSQMGFYFCLISVVVASPMPTPCAGRKFKVFVYGDTNSNGGQRQTDSTQLKVEAPDIGRPSSTPC